MVRTQIQLTEEQAEILRKEAGLRHVSVAEIIRQAVDAYVGGKGRIDGHERRIRAVAVAKRFRSGRRDISSEHDRYLAEAYGE